MQLGTSLCIVGLVIALTSLVPAVVKPGSFPMPIIYGSVVYLPGAFLAFFSARGRERNRVFWQLRFIRLGFVAVLAVAMFQIMRGP